MSATATMTSPLASNLQQADVDFTPSAADNVTVAAATPSDMFEVDLSCTPRWSCSCATWTYFLYPHYVLYKMRIEETEQQSYILEQNKHIHEMHRLINLY